MRPIEYSVLMKRFSELSTTFVNRLIGDSLNSQFYMSIAFTLRNLAYLGCFPGITGLNAIVLDNVHITILIQAFYQVTFIIFFKHLILFTLYVV